LRNRRRQAEGPDQRGDQRTPLFLVIPRLAMMIDLFEQFG